MAQATIVAYSHWQLGEFSVAVAGLETAFYHAPGRRSDAPNILLVHGIGGDHHGMMPLGAALTARYNVYFVELPGHGQTALPADRSLTYWRIWADALAPVLQQRGIEIDTVIGHSFGCVAVAGMAALVARHYVMVAPVTVPSATYGTYVRVISALRYIVGPWYGWYWFAWWRGSMMLHNRSQAARQAVRWISRRTYFSQQQLYYQMSLANQLGAADLLHSIPPEMTGHLTMLLGSHDTIPSESYFALRRHVPQTRVVMVPGGHLLPIESPVELARELDI